MSQTLRKVAALAWKDWLRFSRQPFLMVVSVVMPLMFVLFYAVIVPVSSTNPIPVALEDEGPAGQQMLAILDEIHSQEADYYEIVTTDPAEARQLFESSEALGLIVIPTGFSEQVNQGTAQIELYVRNINSDYTKNLRLRLDQAVRQFNRSQTGPVIKVQESTWLAQDPVMQDYISTSLLLFACLYSAMVNTGLQVAAEWNDRTVKTLLLAPAGRSVIVAGKIVAGLGQSLAGVALVGLVLVLLFGFQPTGSWGAISGIILVVLLLGAGLGAMVGVATKQTLPTTTILIASAIAIFLISGNEDSIRGLAWNGPIVGLWYLARALPTTYAFLAARSLFLTGDASHLVRDISVVLLTTAVVITGAIWLMRRAYSQLPGGQ